MPQCNRCRHQADIDKLERERARLARICGKCRGPCDDAHDGQTIISFDSAKDSAQILAPAPDYAPRASRRELRLVGLSDEARDAALEALRPFTELKPAEAIVVCCMMRGEWLINIAKTLGISKQLVWLVWKRICHRNPIWYAIRTGMIGVRKGGRKPGGSPTATLSSGPVLNAAVMRQAAADLYTPPPE